MANTYLKGTSGDTLQWQGNLTVDGTQTFTGGTQYAGDVTLGDAVADTTILKGRLSTSTVAGAALAIDATTYQYAHGAYLRYNVADWADTYTLTDFRALYLRAETNEANATGTLMGAEVYGVANNVGVQDLKGILSYAYIKGATAKTVATAYAVQAELTFDASAAATTITTELTPFMAKITGGAANDYTKIHGVIIRVGDMDGASRTYGNALLIEDDSAMAGAITWTKGIKLSNACTTGISLEGAMTTALSITGATTTAISLAGDATTGISITSGMSATNVISIAATASTAGINISGNCTSGITMGAQTTTGISFTGGAVTLINANAAAASGSTRGIFIGEDSNSAQNGIPLLGADWATSQGNAFYCDDDGVALVGYTECFTARMLTTATVSSGDVSTTAIHSDLYLNANYTGSGGLSSIWGNTTIAATKTIDTSAGLGDVGGASFGIDIAGTLAANSHACGCSVGVGGSGTKSGILSGFRIRAATGTVDWDAVLSIEDGDGSWTSMTSSGSNTATMTNSPKTGNPAYWLNIYIGETKYYFPVWTT